jgi:hypothetical protein
VRNESARTTNGISDYSAALGKFSPSVDGLSEEQGTEARCAGSSGSADLLLALERAEFVSFRLRNAALLGKKWTLRIYDADVLDLEVIPAIKRALGPQNSKLSHALSAEQSNQ